MYRLLICYGCTLLANKHGRNYVSFSVCARVGRLNIGSLQMREQIEQLRAKEILAADKVAFADTQQTLCVSNAYLALFQHSTVVSGRGHFS